MNYLKNEHKKKKKKKFNNFFPQTSDFYVSARRFIIQWYLVDLELAISKLENQNFQRVNFYQFELFKEIFGIYLLINLFIPLIDLRNIL